MNFPKPNIYRASTDYPYHLSVGVVLRNEDGKILAHHFSEHDIHGIILKDLYLLMRESMEVGESLEQALHRGLREEWGATGDIVTFLGAYESNHSDHGFPEFKTTAYFLLSCTSFDPSTRAKNDFESHSKLEFYAPEFLIEKMSGQGKDLGRTDLDESEIIKRAIS
jgi:hypothetical protein